MQRPNFTDHEQSLVSSLKASNGSSQNWYMWGYLIGGCVLTGFGFYHANYVMMLLAFCVVCGMRIREEFVQAEQLPHWRSIIVKYEDALCSDTNSETAGDK